MIKKYTYDSLGRLTYLKDRMDATNNDADVQATTAYTYQYGTTSNPINYIGTASTIASGNGNPATVLSAKQYLDGLGRPISAEKLNYTAINNASQISIVTYDALGRQDRMYQPIESTTPGILTAPIGTPFKQTVYEPSPLNRPVQQINEDASTVQMQYGANTSTDNVTLFSVDVSGNVTANGNYAVNSLYKTTSVNENGKSTDVFKDKLGKVILTRKYNAGANVDTYNVYDNYGDLVMVIQPGGLNGTTITPNLCFIYKYDPRHRLTSKKITGAEAVYLYYDDRDLLTLTQDGNMRAASSSKYLAMVYDDYGRAIKTGWVNNVSNPTTLAANAATAPVVIADADLLTQTNYYFGSTWVRDNGAKVLYPTGVTGNKNFIWSYTERRSTLNYRGNPVWQGRQHLLSAGQAERPILDNDNVGVDWSVSIYNGAQKPNYVSRVLTAAGTQNVNTITNFHYDNGLRLDNITYGYNPAGTGWTTTKTLSNMVYNYKDQLVQKNIGKADGNINTVNNYLQNVDYAYNVRGWLTNINTLNVYQGGAVLNPIPTNNMTGSKTTSGFLGASILQNAIVTGRDAMLASPLPNQVFANNNPDLFSEEIKYWNPYVQMNIPGQSNGNISAVAWQVAGREIQAYGYQYDDLDRLTRADYYDVHNPANTTLWNAISGFSRSLIYINFLSVISNIHFLSGN